MVAHGFKIQPSLKMHTGTHYKHSSAYHLKTIHSLSPTLCSDTGNSSHMSKIQLSNFFSIEEKQIDSKGHFVLFFLPSMSHINKLWWQIVGVGEHAMHFYSGMCGIYCSPNPKNQSMDQF